MKGLWKNKEKINIIIILIINTGAEVFNFAHANGLFYIIRGDSCAFCTV